MTLQTYRPALIDIETKEEIKTCQSCQHIRGNRSSPERSEFWECFKFPISINVVTGAKVYENCADARNNGLLCGILGAFWEEYIQPDYSEKLLEPTIGGKKAIELPTEEIFKAEDLQANKDGAAKRLEEMRRKKLGL